MTDRIAASHPPSRTSATTPATTGAAGGQPRKNGGVSAAMAVGREQAQAVVASAIQQRGVPYMNPAATAATLQNQQFVDNVADLRHKRAFQVVPQKPQNINQIILPKTVTIRRHENHGFGFTLRHFIVYPPEPNANDGSTNMGGGFHLTEPMDTVFVKEVRPGGPAHIAGLKTGDRLLTVNGLSVNGMQYAHVVSVIQQIPLLLTLQVVPKECDILQTFFSETAHNPETNQRPRIAPQTGALPSHMEPIPQHHPLLGNVSYPPPHQQFTPIQHHAPPQQFKGANGTSRRESQSSMMAHDSNLKDMEENNSSVAMMRLKKNIEQKEEFMRRPNQNHQQQQQPQQVPIGNPAWNPADVTSPPVMQREFYSRPNKLQKPMWPPTQNYPSDPNHHLMDIAGQNAEMNKVSFVQNKENALQTQQQNQHQQQQQHKMNRSKCREQFFNMIEPNSHMDESQQKLEDFPIPANGLHIVSEKTKLFESGRPLSPDGCVDRTLLYKSELSRLNQSVCLSPNVAHRKKEFEQIQDNADYRLSTDTETALSEVGGGGGKELTTTMNVPEAGNVAVVVRREPKQQLDSVNEDERRMRRISYLRATANDTNMEIQAPNSSGESGSAISKGNLSADFAENDRTMNLNVINDNRDRRRHGRQLEEAEVNDEEEIKLILKSKDKKRMSNASIMALHEGPLQIKITLIDGKRSHDRSWKNVWAELRGTKLLLTVQREGKPNQSLGGIDLLNFQVLDANDYTKRKHVFKLLSRLAHNTTIGHTEILIQAENESQMNIWRDSLQSICDPHLLLKKDCVVSDSGHQIAEPQSVAGSKVVETASPLSDDNASSKAAQQQSRKYYLGSRSPSGQSPVTKSRKTPQHLNISVGPGSSGDKQKDGSDKEAGSPKPKTWKHLVAKQLRKIQGAPLPHGSVAVSFPESASIGVPLTYCVPSEENEYVPLIVTRCTDIVEEKGLDIIGIYRIPGNTANITALTEQVNRGFDDVTLSDHRWDDVNVVSSLLKAFLRHLPEPLIPDEMYPGFINADKRRGQPRLKDLKNQLDALPPHNYHTMKHLMRHLNKVTRNCAVNLMEPKNIAIVFGPSVVRMSKETLETAVKDMKHQCCIVEALVSHYQYFFENGPMPDISEVSSPNMDSSSSVPSTNLLLDNVSKIEPMRERDSSSSIVGSIVQAANRKLRKSSHRKAVLSSGGTPDNLSLDSSTSTESKEVPGIYYPGSMDSKDGSKHQQIAEDDAHDGPLVENGSMSLNTLTIAFDNKLRSLRCSLDNSSADDDDDDEEDEGEDDVDSELDSNKNRKTASNINTSNSNTSNVKANKKRLLGKPQPLTLLDDIPFADESPERIVISVTNPVKPYLIVKQNSFKAAPKGSSNQENSKSSLETILQSSSHVKKHNVNNNSDQGVDGLSSTSSEDTDTSTTSNTAVQMIDADVFRKMNRILTNLERNTTKMNRSLSLNYKSQQKGGECCCHVNHRLMNRGVYTLTKDEKTDKNLKKRNSQENSLNGGTTTNPSGKGRRYGNRSIRRRHTVGGTHDYSPKFIDKIPGNEASVENYRTPCHKYVMRNSPE